MASGSAVREESECSRAAWLQGQRDLRFASGLAMFASPKKNLRQADVDVGVLRVHRERASIHGLGTLEVASCFVSRTEIEHQFDVTRTDDEAAFEFIDIVRWCQFTRERRGGVNRTCA